MYDDTAGLSRETSAAGRTVAIEPPRMPARAVPLGENLS